MIRKSNLEITMLGLIESGLTGSVWEKFEKHRVYVDLDLLGSDLTCFFSFRQEDIGLPTSEEPFKGGRLLVYTTNRDGGDAIKRRKEAMHYVLTKLHKSGKIKEAPPPVSELELLRMS